MAAIVWSTVGDIAPTNTVGLAGGVFNFIGNLAGIITPIVIGVILQLTGSFVGAMLSSVPLQLWAYFRSSLSSATSIALK